MISVLIPAYNEEESIGRTVRAVIKAPGVRQVLVVDDGSQDDTASRAADAGAEVLRLPYNVGKGGALNKGVPYLSQPVVALLDGDLGESARELEVLARPVLEGEADLTIATFPPVKNPGGFGLVKGLAGGGIRLLTGLRLTAPLSGQRVMRREVLQAVVPFASGYGVEVAMTVRAALRGFRILEVPTMMTHRHTGRDWAGFCHRGRQFWHVFLVLAGIFMSKVLRKEV
ncbi:glycosyl transferase family 2 [Thermacetogenium phaeum DSM 12270]|uniref:Glucosyl-3-phosphoglycerate synthase n=1 Tax=Thermacetogenium phaeum (strain ATCC BAA-254 / DSM 26808 / PB) TaxID=1089553 RepID=K4LIF9_THEPS|nr:glycosyl transferase family 2 [Thermacetogenium phaeum DSM 12270]